MGLSKHPPLIPSTGYSSFSPLKWKFLDTLGGIPHSHNFQTHPNILLCVLEALHFLTNAPLDQGIWGFQTTVAWWFEYVWSVKTTQLFHNSSTKIGLMFGSDTLTSARLLPFSQMASRNPRRSCIAWPTSPLRFKGQFGSVQDLGIFQNCPCYGEYTFLNHAPLGEFSQKLRQLHLRWATFFRPRTSW